MTYWVTPGAHRDDEVSQGTCDSVLHCIDGETWHHIGGSLQPVELR